jgi:hypothetical protein
MPSGGLATHVQAEEVLFKPFEDEFNAHKGMLASSRRLRHGAGCDGERWRGRARAADFYRVF